MNKFEELHGSQTQTIAALEAENAKLREFVSKFSDNFSDCDYCNGKGVFSDDMIECRVCNGTGKHITSIGVMFVELPEEARALLAQEPA
ncbi:MAG TPA: hypothetical protein VJL10_09035 [Anaerolineales bacterium]|nr:hypothetical protein [Anaerolineales bacterium]